MISDLLLLFSAFCVVSCSCSWLHFRSGVYRKDKQNQFRIIIDREFIRNATTIRVYSRGIPQKIESPSNDSFVLVAQINGVEKRRKFKILQEDMLQQQDDLSIWMHTHAFNHSADLHPATATYKDYCHEVFSAKNEAAATWPPPHRIPPSLEYAFTMNGRVPVVESYVTERQNGGRGYYWTYDEIEKTREDIRKNLPLNSLVGSSHLCYKLPVCRDALNKRYSVKGQRGIVFGSQKPWAEALLLEAGARRVFTYEYMKIISDHSSLSSGTPAEVANKFLGSSNFARFDFGFSFSSFEHDGLGRYGEPLNPVGDLQSLSKASCLIKPGGLFFLGLPVGSDALVFNSHRIYGKVRLPHILQHFELLEFVGAWSFHTPIGNYTQPMLVMRNRVHRKEK